MISRSAILLKTVTLSPLSLLSVRDMQKSKEQSRRRRRQDWVKTLKADSMLNRLRALPGLMAESVLLREL
jgi:hypothetical protein